MRLRSRGPRLQGGYSPAPIEEQHAGHAGQYSEGLHFPWQYQQANLVDQPKIPN